MEGAYAVNKVREHLRDNATIMCRTDTRGTLLCAGYADVPGRYSRKTSLLDWGNMDHLDNLGTYHHNMAITLAVNGLLLDKSWGSKKHGGRGRRGGRGNNKLLVEVADEDIKEVPISPYKEFKDVKL
ncbi:hypothetical protein TB1_019163 [Malus domestica]